MTEIDIQKIFDELDNPQPVAVATEEPMYTGPDDIFELFKPKPVFGISPHDLKHDTYAFAMLVGKEQHMPKQPPKPPKPIPVKMDPVEDWLPDWARDGLMFIVGAACMIACFAIGWGITMML